MTNVRISLHALLLIGSWALGGQFAAAQAPMTKDDAGSALVLSVKTLDFGNQAIQVVSAPQALTLTNKGKTGVIIKKVLPTSNDFDVSQNCKTHLPLAPGDGCTMLVSFTPQQAGARAGTITVVTADAQTLKLALRGNGVESKIVLSDTHLVFRDQLVNTKADTQFVRIENHSENTPLTIRNISVSDGFSMSPTPDACARAASIPPQGSCSLAVRFTPGHAGDFDGTITIEDSDSASPHRVRLDGRATAVKLSVPSLAWNATAVNTAGDRQDFQISNEGSSPLRITNIETRGDFDEHHSCSQELAPHQVCVVSVSFQPKSVRKLAGAIMIRDSDVTAIQTVFLAGNGVALGLTPVKLEFGQQNIGAASPPQQVVLANHGATEANLRSLAVNGDFVMPSKSCGETLAAGQSCQVSLSFSPSAIGPRTGRLSIDTGSPDLQSVVLTGVGVGKAAEPVQHLQAQRR
jgi:hypothetical protein